MTNAGNTDQYHHYALSNLSDGLRKVKAHVPNWSFDGDFTITQLLQHTSYLPRRVQGGSCFGFYVYLLNPGRMIVDAEIHPFLFVPKSYIPHYSGSWV